jgi:oxygen-dependent protoporphyrinogen oxidase
MIYAYNWPIFYSIRFGSIIAGMVQSKLSTKREKRGDTKGTLEKKKRQRGSFSFHGGMQVWLPLKN